jgi:hypothetical protein
MSFEDAEELSRMMYKATGFKCEIMEAKSDFPPRSDHAKWYLLVNGEIPKVYHCRLVWKDKLGRIRVESMYLGNKTEWLGQDYGEEAAIVAEIPGGSDLLSVREYFAEKYPLEAERLEAYDKIVKSVSSDRGINLELGRNADDSTVTLFMVATIEVKDLIEKQKVQEIKRNLRGLKQAVDRIFKCETRLRNRLERRGAGKG